MPERIGPATNKNPAAATQPKGLSLICDVYECSAA